jgi:TRAP transporter TAXI family solute receptor
MSRFLGFVFAACFLAIWTSTIVPAANSDWPKSLTVATAGPGGVFYVYGEELARILTEKLGIAVNIAPSQGSVHNVKLLDNGTAQLGLISMGIGLEGWNGTGDWTNGKRFRNLRALFPMYETPFHAVALRRSGITTSVELDKKRVGVGPRVGLAAVYAQRIFGPLGISPVIIYGPFDTQGIELLQGGIDAFLPGIAAPAPSIQNVEAKEPVTLISFSPEQIDIILKANPELNPSKISAGVYRSLDRDYVTIGLYNFAVARADLQDDLVYQSIKAAFEGQPRLVKAHPVARETIPQNAVKDTFLPFHPGAARYYREIGIKIPDALVPAN